MKKIMLCLLSVALSFSVYSQTVNSPIKIVVPVGAGGGLDVTARIVGKHLSDIMKVPVIVENKPGANGIIGARSVINDDADGRTLLFYAPHSYTLNNLYSENKDVFEWDKELTPVSTMYSNPFILLINRKSNINNLAELKEKFKDKPISFGSTGSGTPLHVYSEIIFEKMDMKSIHVPYKALSQATVDILNGSLDVIVAASLNSQVKSGNLTPLLIFSDKNTTEFPNVQTLTGNFSEFVNLKIVYSFLVSSKTDAAIKDSLRKNIELATKLSLDELKSKGFVNTNDDITHDDRKMKQIERNWISAVDRVNGKK